MVLLPPPHQLRCDGNVECGLVTRKLARTLAPPAIRHLTQPRDTLTPQPVSQIRPGEGVAVPLAAEKVLILTATKQLLVVQRVP